MIIFAASPLPTGPRRVQRAETSFNSGSARSISAASPPAMTVSVPSPAAGGPPETGASIHPAPPAARSLPASSLAFAGGMVEKSSTSCGALSTAAAPPSPRTALSTAAVVGRLSSSRSAPRAAAAGESAACAPAARAAAILSAAMSYAVTA